MAKLSGMKMLFPKYKTIEQQIIYNSTMSGEVNLIRE
jgi:hypothetical protein